jgi:hypothetical protein
MDYHLYVEEMIILPIMINKTWDVLLHILSENQLMKKIVLIFLKLSTICIPFLFNLI